MNALCRTTIITLLAMFARLDQNMAIGTLTEDNVDEENYHKTANYALNGYHEDSNCIYIHNAEETSFTNQYNQDADGLQHIPTLKLFRLFVKKFNKQYSNISEFYQRYTIFETNLKVIKSLQEQELGTAKYGITESADLSVMEFKQTYLGLSYNVSSEMIQPRTLDWVPVIPDVPLPTHFDWRDHNAVTSVKHQRHCGSCWAFSVAGNVEGLWAVKHKELVSLSAQELVDCDTHHHGCEGINDTSLAYKTIMKLGGLQTEKDYPYRAENASCKFDKTKVKATISGYIKISSDEQKMAQWLYQNGPMSVALNANSLQAYCNGVQRPNYCSPINITHAVVAVGYGVEKSPKGKSDIPFWIIKNSWGKNWGEEGYFRIYRGAGTCGVNTLVVSATL